MSQSNEVVTIVKARDERVDLPPPVKCNRAQYERNKVARRKLEEMQDLRRVDIQFGWE